MSSNADEFSNHKLRVLFVFPLIYRPKKDNVSKKFKLLSQWFGGHIFALSGSKQRDLPIANFRFHAERQGDGILGRVVPGILVQVVLPIRLLWRSGRPDVVVAYDPFRSGLAALILKVAYQCKLVVEVNGDYHEGYERNEPGESRVGRLTKNLSLKLSLGFADAIRVLNASQEAYYRRRLPQTPIYRFPDFVATEYFESLAPCQGDYLLSIGTPFHRKGIDVLIKSFLRISEKHPGVSLRIMGFCPSDDLERYRAMTCGNSRIQFIPPAWLEEVGEQIRGCYALVNAARSEAMGRVHVEAMACGKPIVASRSNGAMECVEDGRTGLLCEIDDVDDLAEKLDQVLSDPALATKMGLAGRERMEAVYSETRSIDAFRKMVEEVAGGSKSASAVEQG